MFWNVCGRFTLSAEEKELALRFTLVTLPQLLARYNLVPSEPVLAIRQNEHRNEREPTFLNWGLIPFWAKDISIGQKMANARSETAAEKPAFRGPMRHHRCLIPATGFYEWKRIGNQKLPHLFRKEDHSTFAMAGLWEHWGSPDGSEIQTCTILTTSANALMSPIHHRMPVIIEEKDYDRWLDPNLQQPRKLNDLLQPPKENALICHPVSTEVNNPRNDHSGLIEAIQHETPPEQSDFFSHL